MKEEHHPVWGNNNVASKSCCVHLLVMANSEAHQKGYMKKEKLQCTLSPLPRVEKEAA